MKKIQITIVCGGPSVEHEVSLRSAQYIYQSLNRSRYAISVIVVSHVGHWYLLRDHQLFLADELDRDCLHHVGERVMPAIGRDDACWVSIDGQQCWQADVIFPIIHGTLGEDGSLQGLLRWLRLPFIGADVLGSALSMDKGISKALLATHNIPVAKGLHYSVAELSGLDPEEIVDELGLPLFIKPADSGSSVGVSKVHTLDELMPAIERVTQYSRFILIEEAIDGREIEVALLGNQNPVVTLPGELKPSHEFYDYDAKYVDPDGAQIEVPAELPQYVIDEVQRLAVQVYQLLQVEGLARADFFVTSEYHVIFNEINTLPGFTPISMYPKMCVHQGIAPEEMMDRLVSCAIKRYEQQTHLNYRYQTPVEQEL